MQLPRIGPGDERTMFWAGAWQIGLPQNSLLPGDLLDLAFTVDYNEHPEFGGVQLNMIDFARAVPVAAAAVAAQEQ